MPVPAHRHRSDPASMWPDEARIDGHLQGPVNSRGRVVIEAHGQVTGPIEASELIVAGHVHGDVHIGRLVMRAGGRLDGDVEYGRLNMEAGAILEGRLDPMAPEDLRVAMPAESEPVDGDDGQAASSPRVGAAEKSATVHRLRPRKRGKSKRRRESRQPSKLRTTMLAGGLAVACGLTVSPTSRSKAAMIPATQSLADDLDPANVTQSPPSWRYLQTPWGHTTSPLPPPRWTRLDQVYWTTDYDTDLRRLSRIWGIPESRLRRLNAPIADAELITAGSIIRVHRRGADGPPQSIGAPNDGRLERGVPLPEGPHWTMPRLRRRAYGTELTIETLITAFTSYARAFPEGPRPELGDLSAYNGRELRPHMSHQSGRDVDISFLRLLDPPPDGSSFDAERNWFLVKTLIDSGNVQSIFIVHKVQRKLREVARAQLTPAEVRRYFRFISHEAGHDRHMHVRFRCGPDNPRCRALPRSTQLAAETTDADPDGPRATETDRQPDSA